MRKEVSSLLYKKGVFRKGMIDLCVVLQTIYKRRMRVLFIKSIIKVQSDSKNKQNKFKEEVFVDFDDFMEIDFTYQEGGINLGDIWEKKVEKIQEKFNKIDERIPKLVDIEAQQPYQKLDTTSILGLKLKEPIFGSIGEFNQDNHIRNEILKKNVSIHGQKVATGNNIESQAAYYKITNETKSHRESLAKKVVKKEKIKSSNAFLEKEVSNYKNIKNKSNSNQKEDNQIKVKETKKAKAKNSDTSNTSFKRKTKKDEKKNPEISWRKLVAKLRNKK